MQVGTVNKLWNAEYRLNFGWQSYLKTRRPRHPQVHILLAEIF